MSENSSKINCVGFTHVYLCMSVSILKFIEFVLYDRSRSVFINIRVQMTRQMCIQRQLVKGEIQIHTYSKTNGPVVSDNWVSRATCCSHALSRVGAPVPLALGQVRLVMGQGAIFYNSGHPGLNEC